MALLQLQDFLMKIMQKKNIIKMIGKTIIMRGLILEEKMLAYLEQYGNQFLYQKAGFILGTQRRVGTEPLASEAVKIALALGTSVEYIGTK